MEPGTVQPSAHFSFKYLSNDSRLNLSLLGPSFELYGWRLIALKNPEWTLTQMKVIYQDGGKKDPAIFGTSKWLIKQSRIVAQPHYEICLCLFSDVSIIKKITL